MKLVLPHNVRYYTNSQYLFTRSVDEGVLRVYWRRNKHAQVTSFDLTAPVFPQYSIAAWRSALKKKKQCYVEGYIRKEQIKWGFVGFWGYQSFTKGLRVLKHNQRAGVAECRDGQTAGIQIKVQSEPDACCIDFTAARDTQKKEPQAEGSHGDLSVCARLCG